MLISFRNTHGFETMPARCTIKLTINTNLKVYDVGREEKTI